MRIAALVVLVGVLAGPVRTGAIESLFGQEAQDARVFVVGYVKTPGSYRWVEKMTVGDAIQKAGGIRLIAADIQLTLIRKVDGKEQTLEADTKTEIRPSDTVRVQIKRG